MIEFASLLRVGAGTCLFATPVVAFAQPSAAMLPKDMSAWGMFLGADWVVKAVMIGLAIASVITWTVLIAKSLQLRSAIAAQRDALVAIEDAESLVQALRRAEAPAGGDADIAQRLLDAAAVEVRRSSDALQDGEGLKERVASRLDRIEATAGRRMMRGTGVLATIGATAPFVGLFGTVWGIMNSFIGIAASQTTNLAVVAPGIAEALLATALGLVAAIPAVVIYNLFARRIGAYKALVGDASAAVLRLVSREQSRGTIGPSTAAAGQ